MNDRKPDMTNNGYDCLIIGGGASGLMLAASLELEGRRGLILEKTTRTGAKLLLSGGGRCNITHGGAARDLVNAYGSSGKRIRKNLYRHSNAELAEWFERHGLALSDEKGSIVTSAILRDPSNSIGRVFPASMKAGDVLSVLTGRAVSNGWEIRTESEVYDISPVSGSDDKFPLWSVKTSPSDTFIARFVVIASGGITFPETGSDGSVFRILRELGVEVTGLRSALAPVYVRDYPFEELSGISLPDVTVTVFSACTSGSGGKKAACMHGDLLFTHRGFSGPVILNISKYVEPDGLIRICYNREFGDLPRRMQRTLETRASGPSGDVRTSVLDSILKQDDFIADHVDENGMVTSGGVSLDCIDTATMQIRDMPGLYAVGEAVDADGITGGYNLQMCWSTARTAAGHLSEVI